MSAFDNLLTGIDKFFSGVCDVCKSVVNGISKVLSSPQVQAFVSVLAIALPAGLLVKAASIITNIGQALHLLKPDEKVEDLGDRALQGEETGIKNENYTKCEDYLSALRELRLDPEKSNSFSLEDKMIAGTAILYRGMEEQFKIGSGSLLLDAMKSPDSFNNIDKLDQAFEHLGKQEVLDYFNPKTDIDTKQDIELAFLKMEKELNPEVDMSEVLTELRDNTYFKE